MTFVAGLRLMGMTAPWVLEGPMDGDRATHHRAECSEPSHQQCPGRQLSQRCMSLDRRWAAQCHGHRTTRSWVKRCDYLPVQFNLIGLSILAAGRAHGRTPVTNAHFVCSPLLD